MGYSGLTIYEIVYGRPTLSPSEIARQIGECETQIENLKKIRAACQGDRTTRVYTQREIDKQLVKRRKLFLQINLSEPHSSELSCMRVVHPFNASAILKPLRAAVR